MIDESAVAEVAVISANVLVQLAAGVVVEPVPEAKCGLASALPVLAAAVAQCRQADERCANPPPHASHLDPVRTPEAVWEVDVLVGRLRALRDLAAGCVDDGTEFDEGVTARLATGVVHLDAALGQIVGLAWGRQHRRVGQRHGLPTFPGSAGYRSVRDEYTDACSSDRRPPASEPLLAIADQARAQRDGLDAVETFARVLATTQLLADEVTAIAEMTGDGARHTRIGHRMLVDLGLDPSLLSVSTGRTERSTGLSPLGAMAHTFAGGRTADLAELHQVVGWARQCALHDHADAFAAILRDERSHLRAGYEILRRQSQLRRCRRPAVAQPRERRLAARRGWT